MSKTTKPVTLKYRLIALIEDDIVKKEKAKARAAKTAARYGGRTRFLAQNRMNFLRLGIEHCEEYLQRIKEF